jgi:hypothetical protein
VLRLASQRAYRPHGRAKQLQESLRRVFTGLLVLKAVDVVDSLSALLVAESQLA